jgi:hypothetical protein
MVPKLKINGNNVITKRNGKRTKKCYALSNLNKWGYKSNSVYVIPAASTKCSVYSGDDKKIAKIHYASSSSWNTFPLDRLVF